MAEAVESLPAKWLVEGNKVIVRYEGEREWHRRLLITPGSTKTYLEVSGERAVGGPTWWTGTADLDVFPEEFSVPPLAGLAALETDGTIVGETLLGEAKYLRVVYGSLDSRWHFAMFAETLRACEAREQKSTGSGLAQSQKAGGAAGAKGFQEPPADIDDWKVVRSSSGKGLGEAVPDNCKQFVVEGDLGFAKGPDGVFLITKADDEEEDGEALDARVLSTSRDKDGVRHKDFRAAVLETTTSQWAGWPLTGPRTAMWCLRFIQDTDGNPRARHTHWKRDAGLQSSDTGVAEHELIMRCVEHLACYDQLNLGESAGVELLLRRAQLSELRHKDALLQREVGDDMGEDSYLYLGTSVTRGQLMVAPELEEFVGQQLQREGTVLKERRKLMDERRLMKQQSGQQQRQQQAEQPPKDQRGKDKKKGGGKGGAGGGLAAQDG